MDFEAWALFCLTETFLCLNPGPSALVVISLGMTRGHSAGVSATTGVLAANAIYFAASATGLAALLSVSSEGFLLVRWLGAGYLLWLGSRMLLRPLPASTAASTAGGEARPEASWRHCFWRGFVAQGSSPGLLIYFTAILPQFIDADAPLALQVTILVFSSFVIEFAVLCAYSALSQQAGRRAAPRFQRVVERAGGGLLIGAAVGLASLHRR